MRRADGFPLEGGKGRETPAPLDEWSRKCQPKLRFFYPELDES
jgi:hypothetical protein